MKRLNKEVKLKLGTDHKQIDMDFGTVDIWQIEDSTSLSVELFPNNQSKESFESAEYNNCADIIDIALNSDFFDLHKYPSNMTWEEKGKVAEQVIIAVFYMLGTLQNLDDLKDVVLTETGAGGTIETPIYETFRVIKEKYAKAIEENQQPSYIKD